MPKLSTLKSLGSLSRSSINSTPATTTSAAKTSPAVDKSLKHFVSSLDASSASTFKRTLVKSQKRPQPSKPPSPAHFSSLVSIRVYTSSCSDSDGLSAHLLDSEGDNGGKPSEDALKLPWFSDSASDRIYLRRKAASKGQVNYVNRFFHSYAVRLGTDTTLNVNRKLGGETSIKEFNALLKICIEDASTTDDETVALEQVSTAFEVFMSMKERGFPIEEESYGQVLLYLIDRGMVEQFHLFTDVIKDVNASTRARLGYYEMLLYTRVNDEEKVQEFCNCFFTGDGDETISLRENYLLALCDNDQKDYLLLLLETVDIKQISSLDHTVSIFQSLGRLSLESHAEKFLLALKECDVEPEDISALIFSYATSIPNEMVEDVLLRFKNLHTGIEMTPSSRSYTKLVKHCCGLSEVDVAFVVVDEMCRAGLSLSMDIIHTLLNAIEESSDFHLVQRIYSLICHSDLKPNMKAFTKLMSLSLKINDLDGAYGMLNDLKQLNLAPTTMMYNDIIRRYFREKRFSDVSNVFNEMKLAHVKRAHPKPDCIAYGYLISTCESEKKVTEYSEELKASGVYVTKHFFIGLIIAFARFGQFEKAKQVLLYKGIPSKYLIEIKSKFVSVLASHGEIAVALDIYDEIKEAGSNLAPTAVISLLEHLQHKGELSRVLQLVEELHNPQDFADGCHSAIRHCILNKHLRCTVNLLKRLMYRFYDDDLGMETLIDKVFFILPDMEPLDLQIGLDLLQAIKDELGLTPSRKCLDLLFDACTVAKDLHNSLRVWKEYEAAGLPYNVANYVRMYKALLVCQDFASAEEMLQIIPRGNPRVRELIKAIQESICGRVAPK